MASLCIRLWQSLTTAFAVLLSVACRADEHMKVEIPANSMLGEQAGQEREDNGLKMKFVWCPPGGFEMGDVEAVVKL
ncbi:MAG: hypothetical protein ACKV0T_07095 [Planctomycetales bacterium]